MRSPAAAAAVLFVQGLGVRPEIVDAMQTWRFTAKLGIVVASFAVALWLPCAWPARTPISPKRSRCSCCR
jgi:hypothetical protein